MICAKQVFQCFRCLERAGDKLTGAAGPVFVTLGVVLLSGGAICFFEVVRPSLPLPWLTTPICALIAFNLLMHYYWVCTVSPGFVEDPPRSPGSGLMWAGKRRSAKYRALTGVRWSDDVHITKATVMRCRRCQAVRPERSHHCRICNRCVLKYDHHCPWINQCVGLHNERHFVLFLVYLVVSTFCYAAFGWGRFLAAIGWASNKWSHYSPEIAFIVTYILSVVLCIAVSIMTAWHVWSIARGETSVEATDHEQYRKMASQRGEMFENSYDIGKWKNLQLFFNVGKDGYPIYTLLFPFRIEPYTDGRSWARKPGYHRHGGLREGDELTDGDEDE